MKKRLLIWLLYLLVLTSLVACGSTKQETAENQTSDSKTEEIDTMKLYINDKEIPVIWEDNDSVKEITEDASQSTITVSMSKYGGFEQVGSLGKTYTSSDTQTVTECGDIVLYSRNNIVLFYGSNSWSYTRLGRVVLSDEEVISLLSGDDVTVTLSKD